MDRLLMVPFIAFATALLASAGIAQTCEVPASYATIQEAVNDVNCLDILLASQTFVESIEIGRSLSLSGQPGAVQQGRAQASGQTVEVEISLLTFESGCLRPTLEALGGARILASEVQVSHEASLPCPPLASSLFEDGFESGTVGAWSSSSP